MIFSSPVATAEFSKFAGILSIALSQHHLLGFEIAQLIAVKRRKAKSKGEKERYAHLNAEFQQIARRDKKAFIRINAKK